MMSCGNCSLNILVLNSSNASLLSSFLSLSLLLSSFSSSLCSMILYRYVRDFIVEGEERAKKVKVISGGRT